MPYITEDRKEALANNPKARYQNAGELTYGLYVRCIEDDCTQDTLKAEVDRYLAGREIKYEVLAIVLGCLTSCAGELSRQEGKRLFQFNVDAGPAVEQIAVFTEHFYDAVVAPYEDEKINQNGDVIPCHA